MLTRDGERVLEILLIAATFVVAVAMKGDFPSTGASSGASDAARPVATAAGYSTEQHVLENRDIVAKPAPTATIEQIAVSAAARLADFDQHIDRC